MSGGSQQTSTQTSSSAPWQPSQGYLKGAMSEADRLYDNKKGFKAYPGQTWIDPSSATQSSWNTTKNIASQGNPFYGGASNFTKSLIGGGQNLDQSGYQNLMGQGPNTESDYRSMFDNVNTEFDKTVQNTANDLGDQIQRQFGGASYGAPENADYLTKGVGDVVSKMRSDNFYNNQNLQRGLLGDITGVQQQNFDNTRGLLGDMTNIQQSDINNRLSGLSMADSVYNSQYLPAQQMAALGKDQEGYTANKLQAQIDKFNTKQMAPYDRLQQAYGIYSGTGAQGNRSTTSVSQSTDPWSKLLGGGLLASQLFG